MKLPAKLKPELAVISIIILFFLAFFWPAIFSDMCFVSGDALVYSYPMRQVAWEMIRGGGLPLWTPHILSGYPLLSMAQLGIGYPLTWGYLFLPGYIAEEVYVLAPYLLTPAFIYAYLRTAQCSRLASVLAGLSFTYGGMMVSGLGQTAMFTNAVMWLPLMLIAIERARTGRFLLCLAGAGAAYAMAVLTGLGQGFVYAGLIAVGYGAFLSLFVVPPSGGSDQSPRSFRLKPVLRTGMLRAKPLIVSVGGIALGAGVAAFQIFETLQAQQLSIRRELTYEIFSGGSFTPLKVWQSFLNPIYHYNYEGTPYVALLAGVFAMVAIIAALRSPGRYLRVYFWLLVAALGLLLMMGDHTPLYRLAYRMPGVNLFRIPWRHAFEWTLGVSMLSAFGWDVAAGFFARASNDKDVKTAWRRRNNLIGALLFIICVAVTFILMRRINYPIRTGLSFWPTGLGETAMLSAKLAYTLLLLVTAWWGWRKLRPAGRAALLATTIALACFWEQYLMMSAWWFPQNKPASHFTQISPPARFLEGRAPEEGRVYTSWSPGLYLDLRRHEPHNLAALRGFHDAAGYEPLMMKRYNLAFGAGWSFETPAFNAPRDPQVLAPRWQTLDLLNVRRLIQFSAPQSWMEKDGARFAATDAQSNLPPRASALYTGASAKVDTLSLVTATANSTHLPQGATVANVMIHTADGRRIERELKAGVDTAEWAHERADVKPAIRHSLPPVFASAPGDERSSFPALRYWTTFNLGEKTAVDRVEMNCVAEGVTLFVWRAALYDSSGRGAFPLTRRLPDHWRKIYDHDDVQIYENPRALPRAWMVPKVVAVSDEEALRAIRGESDQPFDPRELALLETVDGVKISFPQEKFETSAEARIVSYKPNRLAIETSADKRAALVVSEINYPGWEAVIDGQPTTIFTANYLLRAVIVPEGKHRVEMRYTAPAAKRGAIITALTLLTLIGGMIFCRLSWRIKK
ncbi:MAG: YfhO family protein [Blastocatellia bacterium]